MKRLTSCAAMAAHPRRRYCISPSRERSEEHTSELQSQSNLVCRLLLEKKKKHRTPAPKRRRNHTVPRARPRTRAPFQQALSNTFLGVAGRAPPRPPPHPLPPLDPQSIG